MRNTEQQVVKTETYWKIRSEVINCNNSFQNSLGVDFTGRVCYLREECSTRASKRSRWVWEYTGNAPDDRRACHTGREFKTEDEAKKALRLKTVRERRNYKRTDGKPVNLVTIVRCERQVIVTEQVVYPESAIPILDRMSRV